MGSKDYAVICPILRLLLFPHWAALADSLQRKGSLLLFTVAGQIALNLPLAPQAKVGNSASIHT